MLHCRSVPAAVLLYRMFTMTSDVSGRCLGVPAAGFGRSDGQPGGQGLRQLRHSIRHLIPTLARGSGQYSPSLDRGSGQYSPSQPRGSGQYGPALVGGSGQYSPSLPRGAGQYGPTLARGSGQYWYHGEVKVYWSSLPTTLGLIL